MILITGGAGFIGSCLHAALAARGFETVISDWLGQEGKWRNLARHPPSRLISPPELDDFLAERPPIEMVFHFGAISDTTATDGDLVWATNVDLSRRLWEICTARQIRFVYASSAATYGDGSAGFEDDARPEALACLRPLNLYGWSKHVFDRWVAGRVGSGRQPPQWAGLKFFNVYGPNEYHKGRMISVVKVKYDEIRTGSPARLFGADRAGIASGEQRRDFIWIDDVVDVCCWLYEKPEASGLFNVGTGQARSYRDLARAVCAAAGQPERIEFIPMPEHLRGQYQSFTQAAIGRLRAAGYGGQFTPLEEGVRRYVQNHLAAADPYR